MYLCVEVVLVDPSAPTHRAFECICLVLRSAVACTPRAFAASVRGSNTRSIGAGKRARGRTKGGQEVLLVIIRGADTVDQVVSNILCAQWTSSGLSYSRMYIGNEHITRGGDGHSPDQTIRHSKQNSCEQVGTRVRSTMGCKQMVHWSSPSASSSCSAFGEIGSSLMSIDEGDSTMCTGMTG